LTLFISGCLCSGGGDQTAGTGGQAGSGSSGDTGANAGAGEGQQVTQTTVKAGGSSGGAVDKLKDMAAAIASGGSYKCTYKYEGVESQMWVSGNKFRSETNTPQGKYIGVSDGVWMYSWADGKLEGVKFKISDFQDNKQQTSGYTDLSEISKSAANVECVPTVVTGGTFTPPGNVVFKDMGEMLKQLEKLQKQPQGGTQDACSYCSLIPDESSKAECLQSCGG